METVVEWLVEQFDLTSDSPIIKNVIKQAKEMEKEQRKKDFISGCNACGFEHSAEDWANEHFQF